MDWAVHMVRLPEADRADHRLETERLPSRFLKGLAGRLALFHAMSRCDAWTAEFGSPTALAKNLEENFIHAQPYLVANLGSEATEELMSGLRDSLLRCTRTIKDRMGEGRIRDGHGDLRLNQIYFDETGRDKIVDCVEFNDRFRYGDVCSDIAFLSMDLACRGRRDLAEIFLAAYAKNSGDYGLYTMVDFYEGYRACVRGMVACIRAAEPGTVERQRLELEKEALRHFLFALAGVRKRKMASPVIALGGGIATGKSTLAESLGDSLAVPVIGSDLTRKLMAGLSPLERREGAIWKGLYAHENTAKVYAEIFRQARAVWDSGRMVIIDASFRTAAYRQALRSAAVESGHPFLFLECRADKEICRERLVLRDRKPGISDGNAAIVEEFLAKWEPVKAELCAGEHLIMDTARPEAVSMQEALEAIGSLGK